MRFNKGHRTSNSKFSIKATGPKNENKNINASVRFLIIFISLMQNTAISFPQNILKDDCKFFIIL